MHTAVTEHLTKLHGPGPWSAQTTEKGVLFAMRNSRVFVARQGAEIVGTLRWATKKPWAIDVQYFTKCQKPLYFLAMAVVPEKQRQGIGRECLKQAVAIAKDLDADGLRLDAYNAAAGVGDFYAKCGWRETGRVVYRGAPLIYFEMVDI